MLQTYADWSEDGRTQVRENFVGLVERRAISLSGRRQLPAHEMIELEETPQASVAAANVIVSSRQHPSVAESEQSGGSGQILTSKRAASPTARDIRRGQIDAGDDNKEHLGRSKLFGGQL